MGLAHKVCCINKKVIELESIVTTLGVNSITIVTTSSLAPLPDYNFWVITELAGDLTIANPTGTWTEGQELIIRIKDDGTARLLTFDTKYRAVGVILPTTTVASKTLYLGIIYNAVDDKFDIVGYNLEA